MKKQSIQKNSNRLTVYFGLSLTMGLLLVFFVMLPWSKVRASGLIGTIIDLSRGDFPFGKKRYLLRAFISTVLLFEGWNKRTEENLFKRKQTIQLTLLFSVVAAIVSCYLGNGTITELARFEEFLFFLIQAVSFFFLGYADIELTGYLCARHPIAKQKKLYFGNQFISWVKNHRDILITASLTGLMCYAWMLTNHTFNHDGIYYLFSKGETISSGRWGLFLLGKVIPNYTLPWLWGTISILLLAVSICIISDMFEIHNSWLRCALAGLVVASTAEIDTMLFMFTSPSYALALLLSILAAGITVQSINFKSKVRHSWLLLFLAFLFEILSLGIYQAYISVIAGIFLTALIIGLSRADKGLDAIQKGARYLLFLVISLLAYYSIARFWMRVTGTEYNQYAQSVLGDQAGILERIDYAINSFLSIFDSHRFGIIRNRVSLYIHVCIWVFGFGYWLFRIIECGKKGSVTVYLLITLFLLPLNINALAVLLGDRGGNSMRLSMSFFVYYVIVILALEDLERRGGGDLFRAGFLLGTGLLLCNNIYFSNRLAFRQYLEYENTYSALQAVVSQLPMTSEYSEDKKLAIIGRAPPTKFMIHQFYDLNQYFDSIANLKNEYSRNEFITYFLGYNTEFASDEELEEIRESSWFETIPVYPDYGFIRVIGD